MTLSKVSVIKVVTLVMRIAVVDMKMMTMTMKLMLTNDNCVDVDAADREEHDDAKLI